MAWNSYHLLLNAEETKIMRIHLIIAVVLGVLLVTSCGDQIWCGNDGCAGKEMHDPRSR